MSLSGLRYTLRTSSTTLHVKPLCSAVISSMQLIHSVKGLLSPDDLLSLGHEAEPDDLFLDTEQSVQDSVLFFRSR